MNGFQPFPSTLLLGTMASADFSHGKLYAVTPIEAASVRPPRVSARSFPSCSGLVYTDGSVQLSDFALFGELIHRPMPDEVLLHRLKSLPPASFSLHLAALTLLWAMRLPPTLGTFTR